MSKPASNDLFLLIRSMSASEKRYFKQYHSRNIRNDASSSLTFFDAINSQQSYDEKSLIASETYLSGFAQQKKHLSAMIMRSLREYHASTTSEMRIRELLTDSDLLREKRLYKQSVDALLKAGKIAKQTENFSALSEIGYKLDEIRFDTKQLDAFAHGMESLREEKSNLDSLQTIFTYKALAKEVYIGHYRLDPAKTKRSRLPVLKKGELLRTDKKPRELQARIYYNNCRTAISLDRNDFKSALGFIGDNVSLIERHKFIMEDNPYAYIKALSSLLVVQDNMKMYKQIPGTIAKLRNIGNNPLFSGRVAHFQGHIFVYTYTTELNSLVGQGNFDAAVKLIPVIISGLELHRDKISPKEEKVFWLNFATAWFYTGNYKAAIRCAQKTMLTEPDSRKDLEYFARLILLFSVYEKNGPDYLHQLIRTQFESLRKLKMFPGITAQLEQLFKFLEKSGKEKFSASALKQFRQDAGHYFRDASGSVFLSNFDLENWIRSKLENRDLAGLLANNP
jgi:tetratricopeptide (TPR) repeat protein